MNGIACEEAYDGDPARARALSQMVESNGACIAPQS
jgi:hypothetical protein